MKTHITLLTAILLCMATSTHAGEPTKTPVDGYPRFAIGGDLSWTSRIIDMGTPKYYKEPSLSSEQTTIPEIAFDYGLDAVRLRVWVDPDTNFAFGGFDWKYGNSRWSSGATYGYCDAEDVLLNAKRFADQGQRIMVAFHLSDSWADPGRQFIPASWSDCATAEELREKVSEHVKAVLTMLHDANINVAWVQIGNETNTGMMKYKMVSQLGQDAEWASTGCTIGSNDAETTANFVKTFRTAAETAREVYPEVKTVLHLAKGALWSNVNWTLNLLKKQGFDSSICDYVGLSLYPGIEDGTEDLTADWQVDTDKALTTMANIYKNYGFRTLLCEIGMNNEWSDSSTSTSQRANIKQCNTDVEAFVGYLFDQLRDGDTAEKYGCDGLFWWEPEVDYLDDYKKGACYDFQWNWARQNVTPNTFWSTCRAHSTFPAGGLKDFDLSSGIESVKIDTPLSDGYYDLMGRSLSGTPTPGIYIHQGKKVIVK